MSTASILTQERIDEFLAAVEELDQLAIAHAEFDQSELKSYLDRDFFSGEHLHDGQVTTLVEHFGVWLREAAVDLENRGLEISASLYIEITGHLELECEVPGKLTTNELESGAHALQVLGRLRDLSSLVRLLSTMRLRVNTIQASRNLSSSSAVA